jgi:hypothetical protein
LTEAAKCFNLDSGVEEVDYELDRLYHGDGAVEFRRNGRTLFELKGVAPEKLDAIEDALNAAFEEGREV